MRARPPRSMRPMRPAPPTNLMESATPFVRVVVINYDGGQMTIDCLESLLATD